MAIETKESPTTLNAMLNLFDENHQIQFDKDKEAARQFFLQDINKNTVYFNSLEEKVDYLVENNYWDKATINKYDMSFIKQLFKDLYNYKHRFRTYLGALKFYNQYALM
jgi:ribonucleoside-diphosphate reductase alpha chain